eukprot:c17360_g1_i4.p2 GENE.c17360_g1_i4~~c17360_g1_i4.p2  ORF type:complete len:146 (+),score=48.05 c17360_g1_i4:32-439(+)
MSNPLEWNNEQVVAWAVAQGYGQNVLDGFTAFDGAALLALSEAQLEKTFNIANDLVRQQILADIQKLKDSADEQAEDEDEDPNIDREINASIEIKDILRQVDQSHHSNESMFENDFKFEQVQSRSRTPRKKLFEY